MPPLPTASVPLIVERVDVATHDGMPPTRASTWPSVPADVVASWLVQLPRTTAPLAICDQPVPPFPTGRMVASSSSATRDISRVPIAGEGLNAGLMDAADLAWKLALVLRGQGRPLLLESYAIGRSLADQHALTVSDLVHGNVTRLLKACAGGVMPTPAI